ncbi:LysE family translocator [Pseudosulfitobacter pseudonitzschiae]|uniref:LysE family translocator n=1 Tax=Pseudosulfitobacter pseudonitzschiae TaxID=1402135 RepID=UPI003B772452
MPSIELLLAFLAASAVFAYMPGPAMLYTAAQTIARGRRAGWLAAVGIHTGGYVHVAAASFGLAILFQAVPILYTVLKLTGAIYLIFLGARMFVLQERVATSVLEVNAKSSNRAFWESVTVEVLNPKTAIFFVAFLPQFTDPAAGFPLWLQLFILGTTVNVIFSSVDVIVVLLADKVAAALKRSTAAARVVRKISGSILVALGLNVALSRQ